MGLNLNDKKAVVAEVSAEVAEAQTIVLAEYRGIQVGDMTQLRANARENGVYMRVLKNTLARRAVEGTPFAELASEMTGPLIYSSLPAAPHHRKGCCRCCESCTGIRKTQRQSGYQGWLLCRQTTRQSGCCRSGKHPKS